MTYHHHHRRHYHDNALPQPPMPMDEGGGEEDDDVFGDAVLDPPRQPSQVSQEAGDDFDRSLCVVIISIGLLDPLARLPCFG